MVKNYYTISELEELAKGAYQNERNIDRLDGWFLTKEIYERVMAEHKEGPHITKTALALQAVVAELPLYIDEHNVFVGTQRDAFAKSYALINPNFRVSTFNGYCDPTQVFDDIKPNDEFSRERIEKVRSATQNSAYVRALQDVYDKAKDDTAEVAYFIEQVTGHLIPDFRTALKYGVVHLQEEIRKKCEATGDKKKQLQYQAMNVSLDAVQVLAKRYQDLARQEMQSADEHRRKQLSLMCRTLEKVPMNGAENLYEAIQSFILLWQVMCLEQAPNPFAFSVGNADRIFEPYRAVEGLDREYAAGLLKHFLVFFNVGDRSWAISQNIIIGGKNEQNQDLTNLTSYALLDAYYAMNLPQPILSVKIHKNTPDELYRELGRFFFTPGCLTPSIFNDDSVFEVLRRQNVETADLPDYSVAGCQEPLIMGKDNGNTTNSWLNLAKILELALNDGMSLISGKKIGKASCEYGVDSKPEEILRNIRTLFYQNVESFAQTMAKYANAASTAVSYLPVPFLSSFMGGVESGIDTRDVEEQGTKYNGSGCLIHGLSVVADSFIAIDTLLAERPGDSARLLSALQNDFAEDEELRQYLLKCEKFGNNGKKVDAEAALIANKISDLIRGTKNYIGNAFRPDFATPSTHLIYGSLVGALPSGRKAKDMLNYGIDPLYGDAQNGLGYRVLSTQKLPYEQFNGGYASHLGLDPNYFKADGVENKGVEFKTKVLNPLFFSNKEGEIAPFYLYVNVTTPETLRKVLGNPKKYAPSGVYIMRIHGTFVNFLDLSPEIQEDIITRLDLQSTNC